MHVFQYKIFIVLFSTWITFCRERITTFLLLLAEGRHFCVIAGSLCCQLLLFFIWLSSFQDAVASETVFEQSHVPIMPELAKPPSSGIFGPIEISPAVIPHYPDPDEPFPPMYPTFPTRYEPVLTGQCPVNFSAMSSIIEKTASDCSQPLAALVGNVICCPQFNSLMRIFQGLYSLNNSAKLVLQNSVASDCFTDIISILASRGANSTIPTLCSVKSSNLTGGSCPVRDVDTFEKTVNTSRLLEACTAVDPLKECCRPICQPAIMDAALQISGKQLMLDDNENLVGELNHIDTPSDCKGVVFAYLSRKLPSDVVNTAFRILSACKVNKGNVWHFDLIYFGLHLSFCYLVFWIFFLVSYINWSSVLSQDINLLNNLLFFYNLEVGCVFNDSFTNLTYGNTRTSWSILLHYTIFMHET